jgi:hypothetical protein
MTGSRRGTRNNLQARVEALERLIPSGRRRVILVWIDREGRRTKAADTHPHLPDNNFYDEKLQQCVDTISHVAETD